MTNSLKEEQQLQREQHAKRTKQYRAKQKQKQMTAFASVKVANEKIKALNQKLVQQKDYFMKQLEKLQKQRKKQATPEIVQLRVRLQQELEQVALLKQQLEVAQATLQTKENTDVAAQVRSEMESKLKALKTENQRLAAQAKEIGAKDLITSIEDIPKDLVLKLKKEFNLKSADDWDKVQQQFDGKMQQQS